MEKNMFENAYFGKPYKTRDGRKALYQRNFLSKYIDPSDGREYYISLHTVMTEQYIWQVDDEGKREDLRRMSSNLDIVSEWQNSFDEDKMNAILDEADKLRETAKGRSETGGWYWRKWAEWGYRKALNS